MKIHLPIYKDIHDSNFGHLYRAQRELVLSFDSGLTLTWVYLWKHSLY